MFVYNHFVLFIRDNIMYIEYKSRASFRLKTCPLVVVLPVA